MPLPKATRGILCLSLLSACNAPQTKLCHEKMGEAQTAVYAVESNSADSLTRCIQLIDLAEKTCKAAGREGEVKQLNQARERLAGHLALVEERDAKKKAKEAISPEQVEKLAREGDPNCPRGQAYKDKASTKEIRCTGLQPVEMGWDQAKKYFAGRNFRSVSTDDESVLTLESGGEKIVFRYAVKGSTGPAKCVVIYSRPGISWQEAVARNTGVSPERLKDGGTVAVGQLKLMLSVDNRNQVARLGECPK